MSEAPPGTPDPSDGIIRELKRKVAEHEAELNANRKGRKNYKSLWEAAEAREARLSEARDDWENEAGEFAKEVDRLKCVIEVMEQERNSFNTLMEAVKRKYRNRAIEAERVARAALSGSNSGWPVPDGWKLVPVELTSKMCTAGYDAVEHKIGMVEVAIAYRAMLAASPAAPQQEGE